MNREKREIEPTGKNPPANNSNTSAGLAIPLPRNEDLHPHDSGPKEPARTTFSPSSVATKATGPRTPQGKERSKHNALKHGIFSSAVVLKGESRAEYESLVSGLQETFQPEGAPEEALVNKLAMTLWRHRRLIVAEGAEIRKNIEFLEWDQREQQREEALQIGKSLTLEDVLGEEDKAGLIWKMQNPEILERCLELLAELRESIEANGFLPDDDAEVLKIIYGTSD